MSTPSGSARSRTRREGDIASPKVPKSPRGKSKKDQEENVLGASNGSPAPVDPKPATGDPTHSNKMHTLLVRTLTGLAMMFGFILIIYTGHLYIAAFVVALQILVFREMTILRYREAKEKSIPFFRSLSWYFLFSTLYYVYGKGVWVYMKDWVNPNLYNLLYHHHMWHCFVLYILGFLGFVISLSRQTLKYQFGQLTWILMTLLTVVVQSHVIIHNIYHGLFWFMLPHSLIICNDIWAYLVGMTIGRKFIDKPLTSLSPNKTWEGFLGAGVITIVLGVSGARLLGSLDWFRCTAAQLAVSSTCPVTPIFTPLPLSSFLPSYITLPAFIGNLTFMPVQGHTIIFALFASLIGPFGGFFASAIKRAYEKKDFDQVIPGHGGVTDRMDCQFLIGLFIYVYYLTWIKPTVGDVETVLTMLTGLPLADQQAVFQQLQKMLAAATRA